MLALMLNVSIPGNAELCIQKEEGVGDGTQNVSTKISTKSVTRGPHGVLSVFSTP